MQLQDNKYVKQKNKKWATTKVIALGFICAIVVGTLLLLLPAATAEGKSTSVIDALFTATTSICVTGLVTVVNATHWSVFGKIIIAFLTQLGGLGVITVTILLLVLIGKRITLKERILIQESYNLDTMAGLVKLIIKIVKGTLIIEAIGAFFYAIYFVPKFGPLKGIGISIFNSISAFCNAGMDIIGETSLESYVANPLINFTTMFLIIVGGIGFTVWWDVIRVIREAKDHKLEKHHLFRRLSLHSKLAITVSLILIVSGFLCIFIFEYNNPKTIGNLNFGDKAMASLFQSVTTRTAGFATIPQGELTNASSLVSIILMFIGGSPVGTAGGIKTTTMAMIALTVVATIKGKKDTEAFGRRISSYNFRTGLSVVVISAAVLFVSTLLLMSVENFSFLEVLYETTSAIATVGLTRGITPELSTVGKLIIIFTMYLGRIGPITMALAFVMRPNNPINARELPEKKIIVG